MKNILSVCLWVCVFVKLFSESYDKKIEKLSLHVTGLRSLLIGTHEFFLSEYNSKIILREKLKLI